MKIIPLEFFAQVLPKWMVSHPRVIQTGNETADSIITVLFSTSILVGGITGCLCDNLIPGMLPYFLHTINQQNAMYISPKILLDS
jgi:hypothetical protein